MRTIETFATMSPACPKQAPLRLPSILWVAVLVLTAVPLAAAAQATRGAEAPVRLGDAETGSLMLRTDEPGLYLAAPLVDTHVAMEISGLVARVQVSQRFTNPAEAWVEGVYVFPLPDDAAVDRLRMQIGDRFIEGQIAEREEARAIYEEALAAGHKAALVEQERPNLFTNSVANIGPQEVVVVQIEYQQTVRYDQGVFSLRFPMVVAPRYIPGTPVDVEYDGHGWAYDTDQVPDASRITPPVLRPEVGSVNPVVLDVDLAPGYPLAWVGSPSHAVEWTEASDGRVTLGFAADVVFANRDLVLEWQPDVGSAPGAGLFEEWLDDEGYLLLMVMPPSQAADASETMPREVVFIVDTSGSMSGPSIQQARDALVLALERLRPRDTFNVVRFSGSATRLHSRAQPADADHLREATRYVRSLDASGGTNMMSALELALDGGRDESRVRQVVFLTDGAVGNEDELFRFIDGNLGDSRMFTVGIGSAPNSYFMRKAARTGHGTFTHIGTVDEVGERMTELFAKLESPVLTDIWVTLPDGSNAEIWPDVVPDLYQGEPVIVTARVDRAEGEAKIRGRFHGEPWEAVLPLDGGSEESGVAVLWARGKIESLMDQLHEGASEDDVRDQVLEVALEHELVSKYTSLVAVDATPSRPDGEALESIEVPLNLPEGWNFDKVFGRLPAESVRWSPDQQARLESHGGAPADAEDGQADAGEMVDLPQGGTSARMRIGAGALALLAGLVLLVSGRRRLNS